MENNDDNSPLRDYFLDKVQKERVRKTRGVLRDALYVGLINKEDLGIAPPLGDVEEPMYEYNTDDTETEEFGTPIVPVHPFTDMLDYEVLILSLTADQAKIVLVRHFGLRGKKAAKVAGFSSEWSLYRREHESRKAMERQREHFLQ